MVRWTIPTAILDACRKQAATGVKINAMWRWAGGIVIAMLWLLCLAMIGLGIWKWVNVNH
jgi:hypothetical protein